MVEIAGAPAARRRRRRVRRSEGRQVEELPLTCVTAVQAEGFARKEDAAAWLEQLGGDPDSMADYAERGLGLVNRALGAARAAAGDPYIHEVALGHAIALRVGYGSGEQVAEGRWAEARELEPGDPRSRRRRREEDLRPQERIATVLGAREPLDACEALIARARVDLDAGREREAALQLRVGVEALLVELRGGLRDPGHEEDMAVLTERRGEIGDAANAALHGGLDEPTAESVGELLRVSERVLRRRRVLRG